MTPNRTDRDDLPGGGWSFPVETDHAGDVALSTGRESIEEAIEIIIGTAKGERVMRPEFGCDVHDHVFDAIDETTITLVETAVREALVRWEPRIDVGPIDARRNPKSPNQLLVDITYTVRSTNAEGNLVYPFYVGA